MHRKELRAGSRRGAKAEILQVCCAGANVDFLLPQTRSWATLAPAFVAVVVQSVHVGDGELTQGQTAEGGERSGAQAQTERREGTHR